MEIVSVRYGLRFFVCASLKEVTMKYLDRSALATVLGLVRLVLGATVTNDSSVAAGKTFDYIVAGAGLSGLTVGTKVLFHTNRLLSSQPRLILSSSALRDIRCSLSKLAQTVHGIRRSITPRGSLFRLLFATGDILPTGTTGNVSLTPSMRVRVLVVQPLSTRWCGSGRPRSR